MPALTDPPPPLPLRSPLQLCAVTGTTSASCPGASTTASAPTGTSASVSRRPPSSTRSRSRLRRAPRVTPAPTAPSPCACRGGTTPTASWCRPSRPASRPVARGATAAPTAATAPRPTSAPAPTSGKATTAARVSHVVAWWSCVCTGAGAGSRGHGLALTPASCRVLPAVCTVEADAEIVFNLNTVDPARVRGASRASCLSRPCAGCHMAPDPLTAWACGCGPRVLGKRR